MAFDMLPYNILTSQLERYGFGVESECLGLKDRSLLRKAGTSLGMKNITPFSVNDHNFEIKGF